MSGEKAVGGGTKRWSVVRANSHNEKEKRAPKGKGGGFCDEGQDILD